MIAKLIVHEDTREAAAEALADACAQVEVWPVRTNAGFLVRCLEHPRFVSGDVDTGFIAAEGEGLIPSQAPIEIRAAALADLAYEWEQQDSGPTYRDVWSQSGASGLRLNAPSRAEYRLRVNGDPVVGQVTRPGLRTGGWLEFMNWHVELDGRRVVVEHLRTSMVVGDMTIARAQHQPVLFHAGTTYELSTVTGGGGAGSAAASDGALRAPMPGKIVSVPVKAGDAVTKGQPVVALEAMKMEHALTAPFDGTVEAINVTVGDQVAADATLAVVKSAS
jgi:propionyl-CoA carboxylase alpha chain/3-methylcrotonyl-CoA carboxylase alpha subunit